VVVFDPLAVVLVISGITLIEQHSKRKPILVENETPEPTTDAPTDKKMFTEEELADYIQEAIEILKTNDSPTQKSEPLNTDNDKQEVIVFQGVEYSPSHYDYPRIREQLELNNRLRSELGIIKNPVDNQNRE
jgi:hypothetical protein